MLSGRTPYTSETGSRPSSATQRWVLSPLWKQRKLGSFPSFVFPPEDHTQRSVVRRVPQGTWHRHPRFDRFPPGRPMRPTTRRLTDPCPPAPPTVRQVSASRHRPLSDHPARQRFEPGSVRQNSPRPLNLQRFNRSVGPHPSGDVLPLLPRRGAHNSSSSVRIGEHPFHIVDVLRLSSSASHAIEKSRSANSAARPPICDRRSTSSASIPRFFMIFPSVQFRRLRSFTISDIFTTW